MARIVDYGSLQTAISEWLWRTGDTALAARADAFIDLFERKFRRKQRTIDMQEVFTTVLANPYVDVPPGYLEMIRLQVTGLTNGLPNQVLQYVTPSVAAGMDAAQYPQGSGGTAKYYTVLANRIFLAPQRFAPIGATLEVSSYGFQPLFSAVDGINWLIFKHPDIYLYGSLMQAAAYIDDKAMVGEWKAALDEAMDELLKADNKAKVGASPLVVRPSTAFIGGRNFRYRR